MELTLDQALQKGVEAHRAGQVQEADRLYTAILKAQPKHPDANHNMGVLAVGVGKVQEALPFFKIALEASPSTAQFWLSYIDALIKLDRLPDAKAVLDQAKGNGANGDGFDELEQKLNVANTENTQDNATIETLETNQSSTLDTAIQLRDIGKFSQAIDLLKDEINRFPEDTDILALLSHCYLLEDQVEEAKLHLNKAKKLAPESASVGWNTARIKLKEKKPLEALNVARDTSQRFPEDVEGMGVLGGCLRANGEIVESLNVLNRAIELNPNYAEALINRGLIRLSKENKPEALADLEHAHKIKPHIKQIWDFVIGLKTEAEHYSDAILLLINMIEIDPENEKNFSLLAACNQKADDSALAVKSFEKVLEVKPGSAPMHLNLGIALTKQGKTKKAIDNFKKALAIKPVNADAYVNMGIALKEQGKLEEAIEAYKTAIEINPDYADAYYNSGNALKEQGKLDEAVDAYNRALAIKPDNADAHYNIGNALKEQGKPEEAVVAYNRALDIKPDYADAHYNIGNALKEQGKPEEAVIAYNRALDIKPDYAEAYNNMGATLKEQGKLEEAIEAFNKALSLKSDYTEAYNNIGITLQDQGKLEEAMEAFNKALAIKPDNAGTYNNIGNALHEQGELKEAIEAYNSALAIKPDYAKAWNNIVFPLQSINLKTLSPEELDSYYPRDAGSNRYQNYRANLNYIMNLGSIDAESTLNVALKASENVENIVIKNPDDSGRKTGLKRPSTDKVVALVHWGRSGTGLLHSLIDDHPEISTLPSIYLSQYFDHSNWERIISDGWSQMADRFTAIYDVIFDATSKVPVYSKSQILRYNVGLTAGMANVGDQRDNVLKVDKDIFRAELQHLMSFYDQLDALLFFKLVHRAYDKAISDVYQKSLIFYHIHNPDPNAQVSFVSLAPKANWVMMVREPMQSCESWANISFKQNDYAKVVNRINNMLFEIDSVIYHKQKSIGVRLEDLKERPRKTIPALCNWMGIKDNESLYEMTAQGKKWWGDPSSPDFAQEGMNPFGKTSIKRKIGLIFSESDQYILQTLFYPFSVRFGYIEENAEQFEIDLQMIRPMMDKMFDFEKTIVERTQANPEQFMKSGSYLYLRSRLIERWDILNKFHTYPNMITPLTIN